MSCLDIAPGSLYNRSMDTPAVEPGDPSPTRAGWKVCGFCHEEFYPKRRTQLFCNEDCRKGKSGRETKFCLWCTREIATTNPKAKFCSDGCRLAHFKAKSCFYCGAVADTRDHFIPTTFYLRIQDFGHTKNSLIVPACRECNSTAGNEVFYTPREKRQYIKERYLKRYKKILNAPDWTETELKGLGPLLQPHVRRLQAEKYFLKRRLMRLGTGKKIRIEKVEQPRDEVDLIIDEMMREVDD